MKTRLKQKMTIKIGAATLLLIELALSPQDKQREMVLLSEWIYGMKEALNSFF